MVVPQSGTQPVINKELSIEQKMVRKAVEGILRCAEE